MSAISEWFGSIQSQYLYVKRTYGQEELELYFDYLAEETYSDVTLRYREGGLEAIRDRYVGNFRKDGDENSAEAEIRDGVLTMQVHCPAYTHTPPSQFPDRVISPFFCQCCESLNTRILHQAGYSLELTKTACDRCKWKITKAEDGR